jgi:hypothetical protein
MIDLLSIFFHELQSFIEVEYTIGISGQILQERVSYG